MLRSISFVIEGEVDTQITIQEQADGSLLFTVEVIDGGAIGDLRALFFDLKDVDADLVPLTATTVADGPVTDFSQSEGGVDTLGKDANIKGEVSNTLGDFDVGVEFGTSGMSGDDIQSATFKLEPTSDTDALSLDDLNLQDFGIRYTSVGEVDGDRTDSLKLGDQSGAVAQNDALETDENEDEAISGGGENLIANDQDAAGYALINVFDADGDFTQTGGDFERVVAVDIFGIGVVELGVLTVDAAGEAVFDANGADVDALQEGQTVDYVFSYTTSPDGGLTTATAVATLTVTGVNDAPEIRIEAGESAAAALDETDAGLTASGVLSVVDLDVFDTVDVTVESVAASGVTAGLQSDNAALEGFFTVSPGAGVIDNTSTSGDFTWSFDSGAESFDYLAAGEVLTLEYTVRASDKLTAADVSTLSSDDQIVTITITGTNDAPVIAAGDSSALTEGDAATLTDAGVLDFADADLTDTHTTADARVSTVWSGGPALPAGLAAALDGAFSTAIGDSSTGDGMGTIDWSFSLADVEVDFLAVGETLTVDYAVTVNDGLVDSAAQIVQIVVTGTNDAPTVAAATLVGDVTEDDADPVLSETGTIDFADLDLNDSHSASAAFAGTTHTGGQIGALTAGVTVQTSATDGAGGVATWTFTANNADVQFLAAGQTITETYTVTIDDGNLGTVARDVAVTITGTNDAPVIAAGDSSALTEGAAATLTDAGTLAFIDVDLIDVHSSAEARVSTIWSGGAALPAGLAAALDAAFSTSIGDVATGDGAGTIDWSFSLADMEVDFLALNETLTVDYEVTVNDGLVDSAAQTVTVTIAGTNDAPVISVGGADTDALAFDEGGAGLVGSGSLSVDDADISDTVAVAVNGVTTTGSTGSLTNAEIAAYLTLASATGVAAGATSGAIDYTFDSGAETFSHLLKDEVLVLAYEIIATDSAGVIDTDTVTVTITGTNDAPDIYVDPTFGNTASKTRTEADVGLRATGTVTLEDNDPNDPVDVRVVGFAKSGATTSAALPNDATLESFFSITPTANALGPNDDITTIFYTFDSGNEAFDFLKFGETLTLVYTLEAVDSQGATDTQAITINIDGTNDAPELSIYTVPVADPANPGATIDIELGANAAVLEKGESLTSNGFLLFEDPDSDVFTYSVSLVGVPNIVDASGVQTTSNIAQFLETREEVEGYFKVGTPTPGTSLGTILPWTFDTGAQTVVTSSGTVVIAPQGFDFLDDGDTVTLEYELTVKDESNNSDTETVTITIVGRNDGPTAVDDVATTNEDTTVIINALGNDVDPDRSASLAYLPTIVQGVQIVDTFLGPVELPTIDLVPAVAENGTVALVNGNLEYTPDDGFSGVDTISYIVTDGDKTDAGEVEVTVVAVADAPNLQISVVEGASVTQSIVSVAFSSNDPDGSESLTLSLGAISASDATITTLASGPGFAQYQVDLADATKTVNFQATVVATEASNGDTATLTKSATIEAFPVTDSFSGFVTGFTGSENLFGPNASLSVTDTTFLGIDITKTSSRGGKNLDPYDLSTKLELRTGFESNFELSAGTVDAFLSPLQVSVDTSYDIASDILTLTPTALFQSVGTYFETTGPFLNYDFDFIFDSLFDIDLDILGAEIFANATEFDVDERASLFSFDSATDPIKEIDILGLATASLAFPQLDVTGVDADPAGSNIATGSGKSSDVLTLELDLDALAAKILSTVLPTNGINPFDLSTGLSVAGTGIDLTIDFLDIDAVTSVNFKQSFEFDPGALTAKLFVDGVEKTDYVFGAAYDLMNASSADVDGVAGLDIEFEFDLLNATFTNDTDLTFDVGLEVDALEFGIEGTFAGSTVFDESIGPLVSLGASTEVAAIDIYDDTFGIDINEKSFQFDYSFV